jgi:hypothetical protein
VTDETVAHSSLDQKGGRQLREIFGDQQIERQSAFGIPDQQIERQPATPDSWLQLLAGRSGCHRLLTPSSATVALTL